MNQQQQNNPKAQGQGVNWLLIACWSVGLPLELLLHNPMTFGVRSVGPRAVVAGLFMFLFVAFHPGENVLPLESFMIAVTALSAIAQISATVRWLRGEQINTRYNGRPYLMWLLPRWNEITIKWLEPYPVLMLGWGIHRFNHSLGAFLMTAAFGLGIRVAIERRMVRTSVMDMSDALIQEKTALESLRNMQRR